jgi:hypothetical protein
MKLWLESLRNNPRVVRGLERLFAVTLLGSGFVILYNYGASGALTRYALPRWLYVVFGVPSFLLLILVAALQRVKKKYESPAPATPEELEQHPLDKEVYNGDARVDYELAQQAEAYIFDLLIQHGIAVKKLPQSPMAEDMGGKFYQFERPIVVAKDFVVPDNPVLEVHLHPEPDSVVITGFEISSMTLHTYATFAVANANKAWM